MGSYEYVPFRGEIQKMRLFANNMGYGPLPAPGEEVEQRLTLTANGKVWLSRFSYHDTAHNSLMSRKQFTVDHRCVESLFQKSLRTLPGMNEPAWQWMWPPGNWS